MLTAATTPPSAAKPCRPSSSPASTPSAHGSRRIASSTPSSAARPRSVAYSSAAVPRHRDIACLELFPQAALGQPVLDADGGADRLLPVVRADQQQDLLAPGAQ